MYLYIVFLQIHVIRLSGTYLFDIVANLIGICFIVYSGVQGKGNLMKQLIGWQILGNLHVYLCRESISSVVIVLILNKHVSHAC